MANLSVLFGQGSRNAVSIPAGECAACLRRATSLLARGRVAKGQDPGYWRHR